MKKFWKIAIFGAVLLALTSGTLFAKEVPNTHRGVATAQNGDTITRADGSFITLSDVDINLAKPKAERVVVANTVEAVAAALPGDTVFTARGKIIISDADIIYAKKAVAAKAAKAQTANNAKVQTAIIEASVEADGPIILDPVPLSSLQIPPPLPADKEETPVVPETKEETPVVAEQAAPAEKTPVESEITDEAEKAKFDAKRTQSLHTSPEASSKAVIEKVLTDMGAEGESIPANQEAVPDEKAEEAALQNTVNSLVKKILVDYRASRNSRAA